MVIDFIQHVANPAGFEPQVVKNVKNVRSVTEIEGRSEVDPGLASGLLFLD